MSYPYEVDARGPRGQAFVANLHFNEVVGSGAGREHNKLTRYFYPTKPPPPVWHTDMTGESFTIPRRVLIASAPDNNLWRRDITHYYQTRDGRVRGIQLFQTLGLRGGLYHYQDAVTTWVIDKINNLSPTSDPSLGLKSEKVYAWDQWFQPDTENANQLRNEGVRSSFTVRITVGAQTVIAGFEETTFTQSPVVGQGYHPTGYVQTFLALA